MEWGEWNDDIKILKQCYREYYKDSKNKTGTKSIVHNKYIIVYYEDKKSIK